MFEKLLANLPYNPAALHQLAFYGKRMRQEAIVRRTGLIFIVLAFFVQFFAFISPPVSTVAYSNNDMIVGGFKTRQTAVDNCTSDVKNYKDVLNNFGISCADVNAATTTTISSTQDGNSLYSMGWLSYGQVNPTSHKLTGQEELNDLLDVNGTTNPLYARHLSSFDTGSHSDYEALVVRSHVTGKTYYILYACGNLVAVGLPKTREICQYNDTSFQGDTTCYQQCKYFSSPPTAMDSPSCHPPICPLDHSIYATNALCKSCALDTSILKSDSRCVPCTSPLHSSVLKSSPLCVPICPYNNKLDKTSPLCKPCSAAVSSTNALACVVIHKSAANLTENIPDANNTTAKAGDTIVYTLYAQNEGKSTISGYVFAENISDVLDYAKITNLYGGTIDSNDEITWPAVTINTDTTATKQVSVQVDSPIASTPVGPSDGGHYDLVMTNSFGNTVNINLPPPPAKIIEAVAPTSTPAQLVNTGPGTSLFIAAGVVIIAGYFFARTRLLAHESVIAVQDNVSGGL
jgi:uncharacterized repeat protein (TIGR01451 family)